MPVQRQFVPFSTSWMIRSFCRDICFRFAVTEAVGAIMFVKLGRDTSPVYTPISLCQSLSRERVGGCMGGIQRDGGSRKTISR